MGGIPITRGGGRLPPVPTGSPVRSPSSGSALRSAPRGARRQQSKSPRREGEGLAAVAQAAIGSATSPAGRSESSARSSWSPTSAASSTWEPVPGQRRRRPLPLGRGLGDEGDEVVLLQRLRPVVLHAHLLQQRGELLLGVDGQVGVVRASSGRRCRRRRARRSRRPRPARAWRSERGAPSRTFSEMAVSSAISAIFSPCGRVSTQVNRAKAARPCRRPGGRRGGRAPRRPAPGSAASSPRR